MSQIQATNNFIFIIRDEIKKETNGLIIPGQSRVKPHVGTLYSIGDLVKDRKIKTGKGKKGLFHQGIGFEIDYEGTTYLVLQEHEIIAIV